MSSFTSDLKVKVLENGDKYQILESFTYYRNDNKEIVIKVEPGYITDFATIPQVFWNIYPPFGKYTKAAVLHDRLCDAYLNNETWEDVVISDDNLPEEYKGKKVKRIDADKIFLEAMEAIKVPKVTRHILYSFVRLYAIFKYGRKE